jgi:hypothetical protein
MLRLYNYSVACVEKFLISPVLNHGNFIQVKGLPFNRYSWLVTHNSFSIVGEPSRTGVERVTFYNQEDTVTNQLRVTIFGYIRTIPGLYVRQFIG